MHSFAEAAEPGISEAIPDAKTVSAVWKTQEIDFHYQSFTTFYSCQALEDRVRQVLLALGAMKEGLAVVASGCPGGQIARMPFVRIRVTSPVEATPQVLAELEETRSTRELAARVRGERPPDIAQQFPAHWKAVSLYRGKVALEAGDCSLVEQLRRSVFPKLAVRVVKENINCTPNQINMGRPRLEMEALTRVPDADAATEKK